MSRRLASGRTGVLALAALVAVGLPIAFEAPPAASLAATERATNAAASPQGRTLVLVRRRGGVPHRWIARLRRSDAVQALSETWRTSWLLRRATANGRVAQSVAAGYAIPLDTLVVDPRASARVTGDSTFLRLRRGRVLLSRTSARLRHLRAGDRMMLADARTVRVAGVISDSLARNAEVVAAAADVARAVRSQTSVVVATSSPKAVASVIPDDRLTQVDELDPAVTATTPSDVIRPVAVKLRFGEFAVRIPYGADWIGIEQAWLRRNIVTRTVPILGPVTCHRMMIAPLRRALGRLRHQGLARLVHRRDYAGCFAARRIRDTGALSLHAWGLAVDINASENPQGSTPRQDRRIVRAFEREGFTWGGRWPTVPDGMHFELHGD